MKFSTTATVIAAALTVFSNPSEARFGGWNGAAAQGAAMIISGFNGGTLNGPTNGGYRPPPSNFNAPIVRPFRDEVEDDLYDDMDDDEDECSTRNFDRVLVATTEMTGVAPNPACARAVFDKICDECEDDIQCYLKLGRQVGPETRECQPRRRLGPFHVGYTPRKPNPRKYNPKGSRIYTAAERSCLRRCTGRHTQRCKCACDERFCGKP